MSQKKRYSDVPEMVRDTADSQELIQSLENRLADRQVVKHLLIMRARHDLSQEDIAERLHCSQSRISKLENSNDDNMRLGDLLAYAGATDHQVQILFFKKNASLADEVKHHFFETKECLEKLAALATCDEVIGKGIAGFFGEAVYNFINMLVEKAKTLPKSVREQIPLIRMISEDDCKKPKAETAHCTEKTNGKLAPVS